MPPNAISNKQAEKTLTRLEQDVQLQLIKRIEPDVCTASRQLNTQLGTNSIKGGPIQNKGPLYIKVGSAAVIDEVEEKITDSDLDSNGSIDSDGDEAAIEISCRPL